MVNLANNWLRQYASGESESLADLDRNIGRIDRRGNGVYYYTSEEVARFTFPTAGEIGNSGRNNLYGPPQRRLELRAGLQATPN